MNAEDFGDRLAELRSQFGMSAREMSLSMGQAPSYINKIETHQNFPSIPSFFFICEFLGITPREFFSVGDDKPNICDFFPTPIECSPHLINDLVNAISDLSDEQICKLIDFIEELKK